MSKYGNRKTNGYASKREASRAQELKLLQAAGEIYGLEEQKPFDLIPKQVDQATGQVVERACKYVADFFYFDKNTFRVVEDAKGYRDPVYRIKRKLMLHVHGIRIREV